jgi:5-formyltetrahydrofolate cyclo-ligase
LEKSNQIKKRFFETKNFNQSLAILFYISYDNEVNTHDMIKECISNGKHVIVPVTDKENRRLIPSKLESWGDLNRGAYGILEPRREHIKEVSLDEIDLIVIPGVAFDKHGYRIGHGMGYYDRLLLSSTKAIHVGLSFEFQLVDEIPMEDHDIEVDKIVTEKRIIDCSDAM